MPSAWGTAKESEAVLREFEREASPRSSHDCSPSQARLVGRGATAQAQPLSGAAEMKDGRMNGYTRPESSCGISAAKFNSGQVWHRKRHLPG
jgi:hypothetical protein